MATKKIYSIIAGIFLITYAYNLFWFFKNVLEFSKYGFPISFFIRYVPTFLGIAGVIVFISSQYKRSNLLRMIMCMEIISFPFLAYWYIKFFTSTYGPLSMPAQLNWTFYAGVVINVSLLASSVVGLRMLSFERTAKLSFIDHENERTAQFSPAPASLRFVNRLIDAVIIFYILWSNLELFTGASSRFDHIGMEFFIVFEIPIVLLYYIILEGIFNTTAGKCATNTTIVNERGERPDFGQVLGRTFCRLIPFEAFSFFADGARGWHDSIPNTYVTESMNREDLEMNEIILDAETNNLLS